MSGPWQVLTLLALVALTLVDLGGQGEPALNSSLDVRLFAQARIEDTPNTYAAHQIEPGLLLGSRFHSALPGLIAGEGPMAWATIAPDGTCHGLEYLDPLEPRAIRALGDRLDELPPGASLVLFTCGVAGGDLPELVDGLAKHGLQFALEHPRGEGAWGLIAWKRADGTWRVLAKAAAIGRGVQVGAILTEA